MMSEHLSSEVIDLAGELIKASVSKPGLKEKLHSRKFWISLAGVVAGICGIVGCSDNTTAIIVFAILEIISVAGYCITEGSIDKARASHLLDSALDMIDMIQGNTTPDPVDEQLQEAESDLEE